MRYAGPGNPHRHLWFVDIASGEQRKLGELSGYGFTAAGGLVYAEGLLVDMRTGRLAGPVRGDVQALDTQGPLQCTPAARSR